MSDSSKEVIKRKSNYFNILDSFFNKKEKIEVKEIPDIQDVLKDVIKDVQKNTLPSKENNLSTEFSIEASFPAFGKKFIKNAQVLDFKTIGKAENQILNENQIFTGNIFFFSYQNILKLYNQFAIYRIKLQYMVLNRKIHLLDSLNFCNKNALTFKKFLNYDKIIEDEIRLKKCIYFCMLLQNIPRYFEYLNCYFLINESEKSLEFKRLATECYQNLTLLTKCIEPNLVFYLNCLKKVLDFIQQLNNNIDNKAELQKIFFGTKKYLEIFNFVLDKVIQDHDPHIDCEYYCFAYIDQNGFIKLVAEGLSSTMCFWCENQIDLLTKNKYIDNDILEQMTLEDVQNIFNKKKKYKNYNFIKINSAKDYKKININYYFNQNFNTIFIDPEIKIKDLPENYTFFASVIKNYNCCNFTDTSYLNTPIIQNWLKNKTNNYLHKITEKEYEELNTILKNKYNYEDTSQNIFTLDYLFLKMLDIDTFNLIRKDMINQFYSFAQKSSVC